MKTPRVCVIGGGIVGSFIASRLIRRGASVVMVDDETSSATGSGMGHLVLLEESKAFFDLARRSLELWNEEVERWKKQAEYVRTGTLWLARNQEDFKRAESLAHLLNDAGWNSRLVDGVELNQLEEALTDGFAGGVEVEGDGVVYPPAVAYSLRDEFIKLGGEFVKQRVEAVGQGKVTLADGVCLNTDYCVVASGLGSTKLLPGLALFPRKGQLAITERCSINLQRQLVDLGYHDSVHGGGSSVAFNIQPRQTGQVLIGSSRQDHESSSSVNRELLERMLTQAYEWLPDLKDIKILRVWTGNRPATPDGLPTIGIHPEDPSLILACGHEGLGITTSTATAEIVEQIVFDDDHLIDIKAFSPSRDEAFA